MSFVQPKVGGVCLGDEAGPHVYVGGPFFGGKSSMQKLSDAYHSLLASRLFWSIEYKPLGAYLAGPYDPVSLPGMYRISAEDAGSGLLIEGLFPVGRSLITVFREIEDFLESDMIAPSIISAMLMAGRLSLGTGSLNRKNFSFEESLGLSFLVNFFAHAPWLPGLWDETGIPKPLTPMQIKSLVEHTDFGAWALNNDPSLPPEIMRIQRASDAACYAIELGSYLWSESFFSSPASTIVARARNSMGMQMLNSAASAHFLLTEPPLTVDGMRLQLPELGGPSTNHAQGSGLAARSVIWYQTLEFRAGGMLIEALSSFVPDGEYSVSRMQFDLRFQTPKENLLQDLADEYLRDAATNGHYAPYGNFFATLPDPVKDLLKEVPLREDNREAMEAFLGEDFDEIGSAVDGINAGRVTIHITGMKLGADPDGLWIQPYCGNQNGPIIRWQSDGTLMRNLISDDFAVWLNAVASALWRDLRVAGEKSFPPVKSQPSSRLANGIGMDKKKRHRHAPASNPKEPPRRAFPTQRDPVVYLSGTRSWGAPDELETIKRVAHAVRGHPRQLESGKNPSQSRLDLAARYNIILPRGWTFVKPHIRGGDAPFSDQEPIEVASKGLTSLVLFLSQ